MNRRVIVTNLSENTDPEDLEEIFKDFGKVVNVELRSLQDKLIGFVTMHTTEQAKEAAFNLSMYELKGSSISTVVEI